MLISNVIGLPFAVPRKKIAGFPITNLVLNNNYSNTTGIWGDYSTMSVANNICSNIGDGSYDWPRAYHETSNIATDGHKYYVRVTARTLSALTQDIRFRLLTNSIENTVDLYDSEIDFPVQNQWHTLSDIYTWINGYNDEELIILLSHSYLSAADANGATMQLKEMVCVDLTACFGSGKEPTQEWCNSNFPAYWYGITEVNAPPAMPTPQRADHLRIWAKFNEGKYQALTNYTCNGIYGELGTTVNEDTNDPSWVSGGLRYMEDDLAVFPHQEFTQFTYIVVFKLNSSEGYPPLIGQVNDVGCGPLIYVATNSNSINLYGNEKYYGLSEENSLAVGQVTAATATYDGTNLKSYLGALPIATVAAAPADIFVVDAGSFYIGGMEGWCGEDLEVYYAMFYDCALTGQEVVDTYAFIQAELAARGVTI
ncbi:MAG: hypothetical protein VB084_06425 [Syntrophomonadaceae bacterium]|nr:hypothetical protein [Syntrophomonadaceae bacterium]